MGGCWLGCCLSDFRDSVERSFLGFEGRRKVDGLSVAADGCLGRFGAGSLRSLGWEAE